MQNPEKRRHKDRLYQLFAQVANALANPHRLELVDLLVQAPRTVEELAYETQMSVANTSQHLQRLKGARLVRAQREGVHIRYHLADPAVARLWTELRAVAEGQLAEVVVARAAYRPQQHAFEPIAAAELQERLRRGEVTLLDVRPAVEYGAGHLPEALSMPLDELERRLNEPDLIEGVRQKAAAQALQNIHAEVRDFVHDGTGLATGTQAHAMIYNLLHIEQPVALLEEAHRVLESGGKVSIIHWRSDLPTPRGPSLAIRPTPEQCKVWLTAAGFHSIQDVNLSDCCQYHFGMVAAK